MVRLFVGILQMAWLGVRDDFRNWFVETAHRERLLATSV